MHIDPTTVLPNHDALLADMSKFEETLASQTRRARFFVGFGVGYTVVATGMLVKYVMKNAVR